MHQAEALKTSAGPIRTAVVRTGATGAKGGRGGSQALGCVVG